jgi:hypothetical protein
VLVAVNALDRLDKDKYTEEEKQEAIKIAQERREQEALLVSDDENFRFFRA